MCLVVLTLNVRDRNYQVTQLSGFNFYVIYKDITPYLSAYDILRDVILAKTLALG